MNLFLKTKELRLPARATLWYMLTAIVGKGVSFLATPFFTRLMSGQEYGDFTLYITVLGSVSIICSAIYSGSGVYRALQLYKEKTNELISSLLTVTIIFSLIICALLFAFSTFFSINPVLLLAITLQLLCDGVVGVFYSKARFSYSYRVVCIMNIISSVLSPIISVVALFFGSGGEVRIYSMLFVSVILALYALRKLLGRGAATNVSLMKYCAKQALPILPHSVSNALSSQADKLIITALSGSIALARYSVAHSIGAATSFLGVAVGSALNPWIIRRLENERIYEIRELITPVFTFLCAITLLPIILAPEIITILAPPEYRDSLGAVLPIAISCLPTFLSTTATVGLVFKNRGGYTAALSLITATLSVAMSVVFTIILGYFGAGLALLISQMAAAVAGAIFLKKCGIGEIFDVYKLSMALILTAFVGFFAIIGSFYLPFRILLLIVPAVMLLNLFFGYKSYILEVS